MKSRVPLCQQFGGQHARQARISKKTRARRVLHSVPPLQFDPPQREYCISAFAKQLREGEVTATELASKFLQRIEHTNVELNSFIHIDAKVVLEQAQAIDEEFDKGIDRGLLAGIPIAVKDNICTKDLVTTAGSKALEGYYPPYDAAVVHALKQAGAVIIGKTNMDEFGMGSTSESSAFSCTRNPWDLSRVPGGSSGGSAVAVASRQCIASIGSDTGGSVRQPASHCGVVGFKPTYGTISRYGLMSYASSFDCIGTLTTCTEDSAILLKALTATTAQRDTTHLQQPQFKATSSIPSSTLDPIFPLSGYKFGIVKQAIGSWLEADVLSSFLISVEVLRKLGAHIEEVSCDSFTDGLPAYYILALSEASSNLARYDGIREGEAFETLASTGSAVTRSAILGDEVKRRILMGTYTLSAGYADAYYERAHKVRKQVSAELQSKLRNHDVLLTPVATTTAPKLESISENPLKMYTGDAMTVNVNLSGLPALVIRGKRSSSGGMPIGLQLIGRAFGDDELLRIGSIFEKIFEEHFETRRFPDF